MGLKYVGITACPTGIAHTYMAAEKLEAAARAAGADMKVETQGSIGAENVLTAADIAAADGVIIAADKDIDTSRFVGKRVLIRSVSEGVEHPERLLEEVRTAPILALRSDGSVRTSVVGAKPKNAIYTALMNGVSHMIPFVVAGGIFIALALGLGGTQTPSGLAVTSGSFWDTLLQVGSAAFALFIPVLSGFIAQAIADRPGLAVGMIAGLLCNKNGVVASIQFLSTGSGDDQVFLNTGFLGAIVVGFLAGYVAKFLKNIPWPKYVKPIVPILIIPIVGTFVVSFAYIFILGKPVAAVFTGLSNWLVGLSGASTVLVAAVLGLMIAFDMGGPVNKVAFLFAGGMIATDQGQLMGMVAAAIAVPPLGMAIATFVRRSLFDEEERDAGIAALFMGLFGITEGAIPFAAADPLRVIPANMIGGAVAAIIAGLFGVKDAVMHGGPIVGFVGAATPLWAFLLAILIGSVVTAAVAIVLKSARKDQPAADSATAAAVAA